MKTLKHTLMAALLGVAVSLTISSCQKGFDAKTYAPTKPPPMYGGYSNTKDIEPTSLVAYWPFSGSLADSIGGATGVAAGTSFNAGVAGQGLKGAANSYALYDTPDAIKNLKSFTVSTWVNMPQNTTGAVGIFDLQNSQTGDPGFWGSLAIFFDNGATATTGVLKVHVFNNAGSTGKDAWEGGYTVANPWNTWINLTVTFDATASTVIVYYNGASAGTNTVAGFAPLNWTNAKKMVFGTLQFQTKPSLTISTGAQDWATYLTGTLDQVRVYNKALSSTQVSALYNLEKSGR